MKTTAIGIRLPNYLLDKVKEYGLENFPKGEGYDKTGTIVELISKGLGLKDVQQPVKQDVLHELEAIKKRLQYLEDNFVKQSVRQVVLQSDPDENTQKASHTDSDNELIASSNEKGETTPVHSEEDLSNMEADELREIIVNLGKSPKEAKKLYKSGLIKDILKIQKA